MDPAGWRCERRLRRGPAARAGAAGPRRARAAPRRSSTRARTPSRRRCSRRRCSGRVEGVPEQPARLAASRSRRAGSSTRCAASARGAGARRAPRRSRADERSPAPGAERPREHDDTLTLLLLCCHPALSPAVAGRAHAARRRRPHDGGDRQRVPRPGGDDGAAHQPREGGDPAAGARFDLPPAAELRRAPARRPARAVPDLQRGLHGQRRAPTCSARSSTDEAIRLTRLLRALLPDDGEVAGLLALMLLTDARRRGADRRRRRAGPARRAGPRPLGPRRDRRGRRAGRRTRSRSGAARARTSCRRRSPPCTTRRPTRRTTDWPQILALYELLERIAPGPDGDAQPRGRGRHGRRARARGSTLLDTLDGDDRWPATTGSTPCARTCSSWPATTAGARDAYRARGAADDEPAGAALPRGAGGEAEVGASPGAPRRCAEQGFPGGALTPFLPSADRCEHVFVS